MLRRRLLHQPNSAIAYLLRDEFTTDRAAGAVNGTPAEPGPGTRAAVDSTSKLSVASGNLVLSGAVTWGDPRLSYTSITRLPGQIFAVNFRYPGSLSYFAFCALAALGTYGNHGIGVDNTGSIAALTSASFPSPTVMPAGTVVSGVAQTGAVAIRNSGFAAFWKIASGNFLLHYIHDSGSHNIVIQITRIQATTIDIERVIGVAADWLPTPLVSDGFASAFGTSDGLGHAETTGIGSGGNGVIWTQQTGTWGISSGKAVATALSGGEAVATVPLSTANPFIGIDLVRSASNVGGVARWTDSSNHLRFYHDGTNCILQQVVSGTPTTLITAAATYSASARVWLWLNGTTARLYYNNALVGSTSSINAALTATNAGIRATDTGNTLDNFVAYAVGVEGQYSNLNQY